MTNILVGIFGYDTFVLFGYVGYGVLIAVLLAVAFQSANEPPKAVLLLNDEPEKPLPADDINDMPVPPRPRPKKRAKGMTSAEALKAVVPEQILAEVKAKTVNRRRSSGQKR